MKTNELFCEPGQNARRENYPKTAPNRQIYVLLPLVASGFATFCLHCRYGENVIYARNVVRKMLAQLFGKTVWRVKNIKLIKSVSLIFLVIIVYLFLPILTWGINDIKGFFNHPVRFSYSVFIVLESIILGIKFYKNPINPLDSKGKDEKLVKPQSIIFQINRLLTIIILLSSSYFDKNDILIFVENSFIRIYGLILLFLVL